MAYVKTTWVSNETPLSPGNMNKLEQGVYDAHEAAAAAASGASQAMTVHEAEDATTSAKGHVQLATNAEVTTGTNTTKAVTPAGAKVELDKKIDKSMASAADLVMVSTGIGAWAVKTLAQFRTWLGLGDSAYKNTGTAAGTVAAGNHTHSGVYEPANANIVKTNAAATMAAMLTAQNNTSYTTKQVRNITLSTADPSGGANGDIWIKYKA